MIRRAVLGLGVLAAVAALASACLSPTLPLPPPDVPDTIQPSKDDPDVWLVSGSCQPGARVTVFDEETHSGGVAEDNDRTGRYTIEVLHAKRCDFASVAQTVGTEASGETGFVLQERTGAGIADAGTCK